MKNQTARFTCGVEGIALLVSLTKGKDGDFRVRAQQKDTTGEKTKTDRVKPSYFDGNEAGEKAAQDHFDSLVKDAQKQGWTLTASKSSGGKMLESIPSAPKKSK